MNCGTCKWWGFNVPIYGGATIRENQTGEWRQCGRVQHVDRYDVEDKETVEDDLSETSAKRYLDSPARKELAVVTDGSDYHAALRSRADFGCVLHEPLVGSGADCKEVP